MKIGLNLLRFTPGGMGGTEVYFRNLLGTLQDIDEENRYLLLCDENSRGAFNLANPHFLEHFFEYKRGSLRRGAYSVLKKAGVADLIAMGMNRLELDIIHCPFTTYDLDGLEPPVVLTFHDLQQEYYPHFFSRKELKNREKSYRRSAEKAARIIAISKFTRDCLVEMYGISRDKIDVVYPGKDEAFRVMDPEKGRALLERKYSLNRPFLYYPAGLWPHKNHGNLLEAIKLLNEEHRLPFDLIFSGLSMNGLEKLKMKIDEMGLKDHITFLGFLPSEELPLFYNMAAMLVFPSLHEGFGMPVIEAMACGCPVACSRTSALPEVVGDTAVTFDPSSPEEMSNVIWNLWEDEGKRNAMKERGLKRAEAFSWEKTAEKTLDVYERTLQESG